MGFDPNGPEVLGPGDKPRSYLTFQIQNEFIEALWKHVEKKIRRKTFND